MDKRQELYKGKAKTVYATDDANLLIMHFRDDVGPVRRQRLQRRADAPRDFAIVLDHVAEIAAKAVLVELLAGLRIP